MGSYDFMYTEESVERFLTYFWKLSRVLSRIGYRYQASVLPSKPRSDYHLKASGGDLPTVGTDGVPIGGIQALSGMPTGLTADSLTIGAYVKIAAVISTDLSMVAPSRHDDLTRIRQVTLDDAYRVLAQRNNSLNERNLISL
jgi:allophanate hydrolase subunit 2